MRKFVKYLSLLLCSCLTTSFGACNSNQEAEELTLSAEHVGANVALSLNVSIANITGVGQTRAGDNLDPVFEQSEIPQELINTLRIIIVRPDYTVEYNRLINLKDKALSKVTKDDLSDNNELTFYVSTTQGHVDKGKMTCTERKRVYLIANENGLEGLSTNFTATGETISDFLNKITPEFYPSEEEINQGAKPTIGTKLDPFTVEKWLIYNEWGQSGDENTDLNNLYATPIIDNEKAAVKKYIPMTEYYDIDVVSSFKVPDGIGGKDYEDKQLPPTQQEANLFITRNFVKFVFSAFGWNESFSIKNVTFKNLSQKEYLFPYNTVYQPAKAVDNTENREIISFLTPGTAGNLNRPYPFTLEDNQLEFLLPQGGEIATQPQSVTYAPLLYFCETNNVESGTDNGTPIYKLDVDVEFHNNDGTKKVITYPNVELPNLPYSLPRNTIVKVNLEIQNVRLIASATVMKYSDAILNPQFGYAKPETDQLIVDPALELTMDQKVDLFATYTPNTADVKSLIWVSNDPSIILLEPISNNGIAPEDQRYVTPSASIELPYDPATKKEPVRLVPQKVGTTEVVVYSLTGLVATCKVTVK